jgi:predicted hotdog family 3-hydroxylacyl-ACP dehydratase
MINPLDNPSITDLLPHRGRMLLIHEIVQIDKDSAVSRSVVNDQWPTFDGAGVSPLLIIELVAQTSGLNNGLDRLKKEGQGTETKGWLVGIKKAILHVDTLELGMVVTTRAKNSFKFEGFREIEGQAMIGQQVAGEVTLQVVRADGDLK